MPRPPTDLLLQKVSAFASFAEKHGFSEIGAQHREFVAQFSQKAPSIKFLQRDFKSVNDAAYLEMREGLFADWMEPSPKEAPVFDEFQDVFRNLQSVIFYDPTVRTTIRGLVNPDLPLEEQDTTSVYGTAEDAIPIGKLAMEAALAFSHLVIQLDFEAAYNVLSEDYRSKSTISRFRSQLRKSDQEFGGTPVSCHAKYVLCIFASDEGRTSPSSEDGFPKGTQPASKRALVQVWWEVSESCGRNANLWIVEESGKYCIARLTQSHN